MNSTTVVIGIIAILFGLYSAFIRARHPQKLRKLEALKELFGVQAGGLIHLVAYAMMPLALGALCVFAGIRGVSLF